MVETALSNCCRNTMMELISDFTNYKPEKLRSVLEAHVRNGEAFRCCVHGWTATHDKLLLKGHEYFLPTHHDESGTRAAEWQSGFRLSQFFSSPSGYAPAAPAKMAADLSRILVIGSTGYFGKFLVDASLRFGHPTFALVRESTQASDPQKAKLIESFKSRGVNLVYGDVHEKAKLVATLKQVDVVICTLSHRSPHLYEDEVMLILAIKEAGNIKRYIPSEFGFDVERLDIAEPAKSILGVKARVRQRIREEGVPYTIVCGALAANWYFLPRIGQAGASGPPTDKINILGDGNTKVALVGEEDVATYTIKAADDPRTLNKIMYLRPPGCVVTHNEMIDLWEKKTGKKLERIYVPEQEVIKKIEEGPLDVRGSYSIAHAAFMKGQTMIDIDTSFGVEASELYPDVKYASIDELLDSFL